MAFAHSLESANRIELTHSLPGEFDESPYLGCFVWISVALSGVTIAKRRARLASLTSRLSARTHSR